MIIRTQENYKTDATGVVWLAIDFRIFVLAVLNTGGRNLPAPRDLHMIAWMYSGSVGRSAATTGEEITVCFP